MISKDIDDICECMLTMDNMQFLGDFMTASVDVLEHISSEEKLPLLRKDLETIQDEYNNPNSDKTVLDERLEGMKKAFQTRGSLKQWDEDVLEEIDGQFAQHYMQGEKVALWLFHPEDRQNNEAFMKYCAGVDRVLRAHTDTVPKYAREYFTFYSIWQYHGHQFPVPLGTQKVVRAMEILLDLYRPGVIEVSKRFILHYVCWLYGPWCGAAYRTRSYMRHVHYSCRI